MVRLEEVRDLVGTTFPGGTVTVEQYQHWLTCDVVESPLPPDDVAHPLYVYLSAMAGMGVTIDELFALCHASAADGPMFGESETRIRRPLHVGATYTVRGGIVEVQRKEGKRAGVFDIVAFELELLDTDGSVAAVCRNSFVFPRRQV